MRSLSGGALREDWPAPRDALDAALDAAADWQDGRGGPALGGDSRALRKARCAASSATAQGEPAAVLFKALGVSRARFVRGDGEAALRRACRTRAIPQDLQAVFDGLSFTKARMLVTYWDWYTRKAGPYAPEPLVETASVA